MSGKHWIIILIILVSGYGIYTGLLNKNKWTDESERIMTEKCITDSKEMAEKYPELTKKYCVCSTEKIQAKFTQAEYIRIIEKSTQIQTEKLLPVFESCLTEYQIGIAKLK